MASPAKTPPKPRFKPNQLVTGGVKTRALGRAKKLNTMPHMARGGVTGHEARMVRKRWLEARGPQPGPGAGPKPTTPAAPQPGAMEPQYDENYPGGSPASADTYSSALDLIRNSTITGLTSSQNAYDQGIDALKRRFFDPTNEFSEAATLATAQKRAEETAFLEAAKSGQATSGSYLQDQQALGERGRAGQAQLQSNYNELAGGLEQERQAREQELRGNLSGAEYADAVRIADDESLTTMLTEYGAKPAPGKKPAPAAPEIGTAVTKRHFGPNELVKGGVLARSLKRAKYLGGARNVKQIKKGGVTGAEARRVKQKAATKKKNKGK